MWMLSLNDMRHSKSEELTNVAYAETKEELIDFLSREKVESYSIEDGDKTWGKEYRQGGPLEWFNPPVTPNEPFFKDMCDLEYWITDLKSKWDRLTDGLIKL